MYILPMPKVKNPINANKDKGKPLCQKYIVPALVSTIQINGIRIFLNISMLFW